MAPSGVLFLSVLLCLFSPLLFGFSLAFTSPATSTMQFEGKNSSVVAPPSDLIVFDSGFQESAFA